MNPFAKFLLAATLGFIFPNPTSAETYEVDATHSALIFSIQHMGLGNTWGRFNDFSGKITLDPAHLDQASIEVKAVVASVDSGNKKRDDHLRNTDIFDAGTYPEMSFSGTGFKDLGEGRYEVSGTFVLREIKQALTVTLRKVGEGKHLQTGKPALGFETEFSIDRKAFGVGQGKVDGALGQKVRVIVALEALAK
ncbi:MAG: YceI family protein [Planctomycetes bacterium]|nr:YceI family protein [Planctomycetota bacterium]